ncbi:hypothetical protein NP233_g8490 [Leucocoprinus birnbaumii]|uniref:Uncharacterized protein n=1 Tax=Leucocoprinus birnbaumii TaxID=56174 RepID=A0AAD5VM91_9AGAR|nr:hypothetical protein NP233_g8490 [Leucocoprinus birnbaumii]
MASAESRLSTSDQPGLDRARLEVRELYLSVVARTLELLLASLHDMHEKHDWTREAREVVYQSQRFGLKASSSNVLVCVRSSSPAAHTPCVYSLHIPRRSAFISPISVLLFDLNTRISQPNPPISRHDEPNSVNLDKCD